MNQLDRPHAELHETIRQIIEMRESGRTAEAEAAYAKVEPLSKQVVQLLERIEQKSAAI